eukprot:TRINITY_DN22372_c0_g1_i1.p1 TRINITY_DN22372_c0_g1~~TRINITY_DN22372_c0_g1_i1.p1  ORF type:complete len:171 (-),score=20.86 TRINITY_DN22372_c0_g1_i1:317-781(-)
MAAGKDVGEKAEWYAKVFVQDRQNHLSKYIIPALDNGTHVICDRYKHSTLCYQHTQGMSLSTLTDMHAGMLVPDLTIIFDCPAAIAYERRQANNPVDVFDKDIVFQERLRQNYLKVADLLQKTGDPILIINAERSINEIATDVEIAIKNVLLSA